MENNLFFMAVNEDIDTDGIRTKNSKEVPMSFFHKIFRKMCSEVTKEDFDAINGRISKIELENRNLRETLEKQNQVIEQLQTVIDKISAQENRLKELTLKITPVVEDYNASKLRPNTLYKTSVGHFIKINEKFENASAYILRQTIKNDKPMILPLNSLMKFIIDPKYKIEQKYLSIIIEDECLNEIFEDIVEFHKECFKNINSYLESKGTTIDKCVKLLDSDVFLSDFMEYKPDCKAQSAGKVFVLSLFYNFPETDAPKHKAMVYPNIIKE